MSNPSERLKPKNQNKPFPSVRCFLAISLDKSIKEQLFKTWHCLQTQIGADNYKWTAPEKWHLTLKFLGYIPENDLLSYSEMTRKHLKNYHGFDIQLDSIGCLPSLRRPRVLVASLKHSSKLLHLAEDLEKMARTYGLIAEERQYHPHITLARSRHKKTSCLKIKLPELEPASMHVRKITLYRSQLHPDGACYTVVAEYPLL